MFEFSSSFLMLVADLVVVLEVLDRSQGTRTGHRAHAGGKDKSSSYRTDGVNDFCIGSYIATLDSIGFP